MSPTAPGGQGLTPWGQGLHLCPLQPLGVRASPRGVRTHTRVPYSPHRLEPHPTGAGLTSTSPTAPGVRPHPTGSGLTPASPTVPGVRPHPTGAGLTDTSWESMPDKEKHSHIPSAELWLTEKGQGMQSNRLANTTAIAWGNDTCPRDRQWEERSFKGREGL